MNYKEKMNITNNKYYFGAYANMALLNVYMILNDIAKKTRLAKIARSGLAEDRDKRRAYIKVKDFEGDVFFNRNGECQVPVLEILKEANEKVNQQRVIELLHEHFPFLKALNNALATADPDPESYYGLFKMLLSDLTYLRNFYTHAHHKQLALQPACTFKAHNAKSKKYEEKKKNTFQLLEDEVFSDCLNAVRSRKTENQIIPAYFERYIYKYDKELKKKIREPNEEFRFCFTNICEAERKPEYEDKQYYTEKGLAFFLGAFQVVVDKNA